MLYISKLKILLSSGLHSLNLFIKITTWHFTNSLGRLGFDSHRHRDQPGSLRPSPPSTLLSNGCRGLFTRGRWCRDWESAESYLHSRMRLHGVVLTVRNIWT